MLSIDNIGILTRRYFWIPKPRTTKYNNNVVNDFTTSHFHYPENHHYLFSNKYKMVLRI